MSTKFLIWGAAAALLGLTAGAVLAGGRGDHWGGQCPFGRGGGGVGWFGHGPGERLGDLIDDLELTEAQKESIKGILREARGRIEPRLEEAHTAKQAVFDAVLATGDDEEAVREAGEAAARVVSDLTLEMARTAAVLRGALTPEQRQELEKKLARHRERRQERTERFREFRQERFEEFLESL